MVTDTVYILQRTNTPDPNKNLWACIPVCKIDACLDVIQRYAGWGDAVSVFNGLAEEGFLVRYKTPEGVHELYAAFPPKTQSVIWKLKNVSQNIEKYRGIARRLKKEIFTKEES